MRGAIGAPVELNTGETTRITVASCRPLFKTPEEPGASRMIPVENLSAYVVRRDGEGVSVERYELRGGRLHSLGEGEELEPVSLPRGDRVWMYFTHRFDLNQSLFTPAAETQRLFAIGGDGLPLLGPVSIPTGEEEEPEIALDIWRQNDWVCVPAHGFERTRPDKVVVARWREDYEVGAYRGERFHPHTNPAQKKRQEEWSALMPILPELASFPTAARAPRWVGTLSAVPDDASCKLLIVEGDAHVASVNKLRARGNVALPGHHLYDLGLVRALLDISPSDAQAERLDALPDPPAACHLPGDIPWHGQGQTPHCGPYCLAAAACYWFPHSYHPGADGGAWFAEHTPSGPGGSRSPGQLREALRTVDGLRQRGLFTRDGDADNLSRGRALKLLKLWIQAGVPVIVLVKEKEWSAAINALMVYHWKLLVGYDEGRFYFLNSGAEREIDTRFRQPGVEYEKAPVGNDVDSADHFYEKWNRAGGDLVDAFSDVDRCTFLPVVPMDPRFAAAPPDTWRVSFLGFRLTRAWGGERKEKLNLSIAIEGHTIFEIEDHEFRVLQSGWCYQREDGRVVESGYPSELGGWPSQVRQSVLGRPGSDQVLVQVYCSRREHLDEPGVMLAAFSGPVRFEGSSHVEIPLSNHEEGDARGEATVRLRFERPQATAPSTSWGSVC